MYSVEDLLISHGYKLPKHTTSTSSTPTPVPASSAHPAPPGLPPSYAKRRDILENRPASRALNGYERGIPYATCAATRQPQVYAVGCPSNNNEPRDRTLPGREGESRSQNDTHSLGESLTSDSGFCDGGRGPQSQSRDVSYWRRRGQDFTVLLDYADYKDPGGGGQGGHRRPEGPQQARGQELSADERRRLSQERQRWAAQAQTQAPAGSREREAALHQWRTASERKCQSLGTDEWHPAVSFGHQLSQSEGERWTQGQQRLHARTPEGMAVHARTKAKSQSLPRMLQQDSLQYVDVASSSQQLYRRVNGHPLSHHDIFRAPRWPDNGRPASANQLSMTPKPRLTRPPRPPSYEMHQQIRGSCEVLSGRDSVVPQARDRTPLPLLRRGESQLEYFAQDSGPPGYIPPPSYKRAPLMGGALMGGALMGGPRRGYGQIHLDYRYRGDVYQQIHVAPDGSHWLAGHPAGSWSDPHRERIMSSQKQLYPVYTSQERPGGGVQYIPFDDPRIRHISSALGGNSLTDADKIRHIRNELPSVTVSEPASDDSAFLPPPLGPFIAAELGNDVNLASSSDFDNDNNRWHSDLHKETVDNFPATDQNCNKRYPKNHRPPPSPSSAFQASLSKTLPHQRPSSEQVFAETITQVKKIVPDSGHESIRNTKRRVSETIFCLVSVPVHTPSNINKDFSADQNNNETLSSLSVSDTFAVGLKESHNVRSRSVNEIPIKSHYSHFHTSSTSSVRNYKRAPLRKEIIDAWALQANEDKELCYVGSWPGNQYRNQETQTGSPLTVVKSPEPQNPPDAQHAVQCASVLVSNVRTDSNSSYGFPMAGQKNLHPSSNSAFSRLSPTLSPSLDDPPSPSKEDRGDQLPSSPRKKTCSPQDGAEQVVFGQFLLKPVNRRPCDAIGELESINKEMEDTISKRPSMSHCLGDLDGVNKKLGRFRPGAHFTAGPEPGREAFSLPPMHKEKPNNLKVRSKSFTSAADLDSEEISSAFSRPRGNNISSAHEQSIRPKSSLPQHSESKSIYRQDIPVPQESLLKDVGLTVYTETPGGPGEPVQRSLSVPSPLDLKEFSQSVELSHEGRTAFVKNRCSPEHNLNEELQAEGGVKSKAETDSAPQLQGEVNLSICRTRSETSGSPRVSRLTREASFMFEDDDDDGDERYTISEPLTYKNESTVTDKHLENLLIQEKANSLPTEDLSNLYEVKCAKGIPENESIEQRAARILGIAVPVEALGVADKQVEDDQVDTQTTTAEDHQSAGENVTGECEHVEEESLIVQGPEEVEETESDVELEDSESQKHSSHRTDEHDTQPAVVLGLPEFPPSKLSLSLPITTDEKLALSMCTGEKRGKLIESLQGKLNSASFSLATSRGTERTARLKELDSVSQIQRLSLKGSDGDGAEDEEKDGDVSESQGEGNEEEQGDKEDEKPEEENSTEPGSERGTEARMARNRDDCETVKDDGRGCHEEQRQEEETKDVNIEIAPKVHSEGSEEVAEVKGEEPENEAEPKTVEEDKKLRSQSPVRAEATRDRASEKLPKPKRRTRLQKPPLLPKPRSVPKREITLPPSVSTGTRSPSNMDDDETFSISDSYDPSRVERV